MFLAIDRVAKLTYVEFHECAGKMEGAAFLEGLPYQIHTRLTDKRHGFCRLAQEPAWS